ncbi:protein kinase, putative [Trichomonas vaginalis G3]|uniref:non-specific serine/threonine protein kinase n=1 Tax=Trichomonas vaginalis (strain ATCC PRA-98 / G3) TaxID=412133 RepID=A2FYS7_TRIV3|nr:protein kinase protein [Trichomonas vaginalis G3]EAX89950.1 protein kinase, putative [Trichomonas vaginalis G3]KAI5528386.1 protein kinase protein [Trichomonas vaginalis G3]|eukprot:XP_001302880.1 protein kinase [Trichomonas vaginalis G3]
MRHNQQLSLKTVLIFADQAICLIQYMHERHFIHRDIKPENFLIGTGKKSNLIYLIDFGLSKKYRDPKTKEHIPYRGDKELVGTSRYVSINTHLGIEQSRRDDLESLGYVLVYLLKGQLPWQGIQSENLKQKYEKIGEKKMTTSFDMLCQDLPEEFIKYFEIVRALDFAQEPPYSQLRQIFRECFLKHDFVYDYKYDWSNGNDKETCKNYDPVPMHAPIFKDHEAGLEILPKNERNHPNFRYATPNIENNRIQQITEQLTTVKARTAITNKRVWVDPGKRQTFPRGPPPIPAKMLPPPKKKGRLSRTTQLAQKTFSLLVSPTSSLRQQSQSQNKFDVASTTPSLASDNIPIHPNTAPEPVKTMSLDAPYKPEEIPEDDEN